MPEPALVDRAEQLTSQWLEGDLQLAGLDVGVTSVRHEPVGTGQMADSFRVRLEYATRAPDAPDSVVVKLPAADPTSRRSGGAGGYAKEVYFYTELAPHLAIRTPRCWFGALSPEADSFTLVLEDLAPARQGDQIAGCSRAQAELALVNLAGLHAPLWCEASLGDYPWLGSMTAESAAGLGGLMKRSTEAFLERYAGRLGSPDEKVLREFADAAEPWLLSRPDRFAPVHGDYRLDNLLFGTDEGGPPVATVDWQTISIANPGRDVAYFLGNAMDPAERRRHEHDLVRAYLEALRRQGVEDYAEDTCFDDYRCGHFQGLLVTVLGSLAVEQTERGDAMFMAMATRACQAIRDLDSTALFGSAREGAPPLR